MTNKELIKELRRVKKNSNKRWVRFMNSDIGGAWDMALEEEEMGQTIENLIEHLKRIERK